MHTQLTSSGAGWGAGSLDEDAEELDLLARYLRQHFGSTVRVPCGHPSLSPTSAPYCEARPDVGLPLS